MDTRFWGPSAWKLFHLVTQQGSDLPEEASAFFTTIPFILPCKFCRASITDYYRDHPFPKDKKDLPKWMYAIHNRVNDKLRSQGLHPSPNPSYLKTKQYYAGLSNLPWQEQLSYFWDFLFSVGYHHPKEKQLYDHPMPECPKGVRRCHDTAEKNKWNVLPLRDRMEWFTLFWRLLPAVLPPSIASHWINAQNTICGSSLPIQSRASTLEWLWKMRCSLEQGYHDPYLSVCKKVAKYSSDCAKQKGAFTCRKRKAHGKTLRARGKTLITRRTAVKKTKKHTRS
jgi:hypothetical protein